MKGVSGLLIAVALGIVGAFCNWMYLAQKGQELERIDFIGIAENVKINPGDKFSESQFMQIWIPQNVVGNLDKAAVRWSDRATVVGQPATKSYSPGEVLLRQQLRTPPEMDVKRLLAPDEVAMWIPVDTRTFVAQLVNSGDTVSFIVPRMMRATPVAETDDAGQPRRAAPTTERIGPFRILALGNRLGSPEVMRAAGISPAQENVMTVAVKVINGELEEKGQQVSELLRQTNFQQVQVVLHPTAEAGKGLK